jgi:hypothetical protein
MERYIAAALLVVLLVSVSWVLWYMFGDGFLDLLKAVGIILLCATTIFILIYLISVLDTGSWTAFFTTEVTSRGKP